jgi:hypothetical protein
LFDSEISHQHYVQLTITRCERRRHLNRDWFFPTQTILEASISKAQFGAIVSSFGQGTGVPATLEYYNGEHVASAPVERRLDESHREVKAAASDAFAEVKTAAAAVEQGFADKLGRREMGPLIGTLTNRIGNAPANVEFAAKSLTEHVEKVVTKARADVEGMVLNALAANGATELPEGTSLPIIELGQGE